ncbi:MAG: Crp/Fnr family transcriptional regulator [Acetobacteraceae bacterium]|nr:Crp/Fnr family transcriptional regulator [Acetobacteraceae bacterium]
MAIPAVEARRDALKASPLFRTLQPGELDSVVAVAATKRFERGSVILRRTDPGTGMVVVLSGRIRVSATSEEGKEVTLAILGPGEILGELSLLDGEARSADAIALEECIVLTIERAPFLRLLQGNAGLCLRLITVLCGRLRRANAALEDLALLELPARLARLLVQLAKDYGISTPHGTRIGVKLSQKDLSTLVGSSREKVNRQLRQWEQSGLISQERGHVTISNADRLLAHFHAE